MPPQTEKTDEDGSVESQGEGSRAPEWPMGQIGGRLHYRHRQANEGPDQDCSKEGDGSPLPHSPQANGRDG